MLFRSSQRRLQEFLGLAAITLRTTTKRLSLQLRKDYHWHKLSPVTIKKIITDKTGIATSTVTSMYPVRSGIALKCALDALRDTIIGISPSLLEDNTIIGAVSHWKSSIVSHVPLYIRTPEVSIPVTKNLVKNE